MCTVTYLPIDADSYLLTSNRDEHVARKPALPFAKYEIHGSEVYFPKDTHAHGSWIAHNRGAFTLCLLNGAFEPHKHMPPYRLSRGIMLLDFFEHNNTAKFIHNYRFNDIEPFTLIVVEQVGNKIALTELRWDGQQMHQREFNSSEPKIWSSVMLYPQPVIDLREKWFNEWLQQQTHETYDRITDFHLFAGDGHQARNLVFRDGMKHTVSISSIHVQADKSKLWYRDLITNKTFIKEVS
ncbi:MAG: NRDE family protein [Bacteroidetes bacterium]|nr:NRDE family protein [Bacteroidota bacterium]